MHDAYTAGRFNGPPCGYPGREPIAFNQRAPRLTDQGRRDIEDVCSVIEYNSVVVRGTLFRSKQARQSVHDNTGVMMRFLKANGTAADAYGIIHRMYDLDIDGVTTAPLFEAEWFDVHGTIETTSPMAQTITHIFKSNRFTVPGADAEGSPRPGQRLERAQPLRVS